MRRRAVALGALVAMLAGALVAAVPAPADAAVRSFDVACPATVLAEDAFDDVGADSVHHDGVSCITWWGLAQGNGAGDYLPHRAVSRGQLASFLARAIETSAADLPSDPPQRFADAGPTHGANIHALAELGIANGVDADSYQPQRPVTRGQAATLLAATYAHISGSRLPSGDSGLDDVDDAFHADAIERVVEAGLAAGRRDGTFGPTAPLTRGQMATVLGRLLDLLTAEGHATRPASPIPELDCNSAGFPCTWAEADEAAWNSSIDLLETVRTDLAAGGDVDAVAADLDARSEVVHVDADPAGITFRVDGGLPVVVLTEQAGFLGGGGVDEASVEAATFDPVGREPGRGNDEGGKRALVIDPYGACLLADDPIHESPCDHTAPSPDAFAVSQRFAANEQYTTVEHLVGDAVTPEVMADLDTYDAVQIISHGTHSYVTIELMREWIEREDGTRVYVDHDGSIIGQDDAPDGEGLSLATDVAGNWMFGYNTTFFDSSYPFGMRHTIAFLAWCQSAQGAIANTLAGPRSAVYGWSELIEAGHNRATIDRFWELLLDDGVSTAVAYEQLDAEGLTTDPAGPAARLVEAGDATGIRAIDPVTSAQADGPIGAGDDLEWTGTIGDDNWDHLDELTVRVDGVRHGTEGDVEIEAFLSDTPFVEKLDLADATEVESGPLWSDWQVTVEDLRMPFRVHSQDLYDYEHDWRVEVSDGEHGAAAHKVEPVYLRGAAVRAVHPDFFSRLSDGDVITVDGTEEDGVVEEVAPIVIEVADVPADDLSGYRVDVTVTGQGIDGAHEFDYALREFAQVDELLWRTEEEVALAEDLTDDNDEVTIDVALSRNDEKQSSHEVTIELDAEEEGDVELSWNGNYRNYEGSYPNDFWNTYTTDGDLASPCDEQHGWSQALSVYANSATGDVREIMINIGDVSFAVGDLGDDTTVAVPAGETGTFTAAGDIMLPADWPQDAENSPTAVSFDGTLEVEITRNEISSEEVGGQTVWLVDHLEGTVTGTLVQKRVPDEQAGAVEVNATFSYDAEACSLGAGDQTS